jgi:hypothetical protein
MRKPFLMLASGLIVSLGSMSSSTNAQVTNAQVTGDNRAVVVFELDAERFVASEMFQKNQGHAGRAGPIEAAGQKIKLEEIKRVYGAIGAAPDMKTIEDAKTTGLLPFDLFVQIQFKSVELAEKAYEQAKLKCVPKTIEGKQYHAIPPNTEKAPENMLVHRFAPDTIEIGTEAYLTLPNRNVLSENLVRMWPEIPDSAIRLALDVDGIRHLIEQGLLMPNPIAVVVHPVVMVVEHTSVIRLAVDFSSDTILWLSTTGKDEETTEKIDLFVAGLMATAKDLGKAFVPQVSPKMQAPIQSMLDGISKTVRGNDVTIVIPHPPGLADAFSGVLPDSK